MVEFAGHIAGHCNIAEQKLDHRGCVKSLFPGYLLINNANTENFYRFVTQGCIIDLNKDLLFSLGFFNVLGRRRISPSAGAAGVSRGRSRFEGRSVGRSAGLHVCILRPQCRRSGSTRPTETGSTSRPPTLCRPMESLFDVWSRLICAIFLLRTYLSMDAAKATTTMSLRPSSHRS